MYFHHLCLVVALVVGRLDLGGHVECAGDGVVVGEDEGGEGDVVHGGDHVTWQPHVTAESLLLGQQVDDALLVGMVAI